MKRIVKFLFANFVRATTVVISVTMGYFASAAVFAWGGLTGFLTVLFLYGFGAVMMFFLLDVTPTDAIEGSYDWLVAGLIGGFFSSTIGVNPEWKVILGAIVLATVFVSIPRLWELKSGDIDMP